MKRKLLFLFPATLLAGVLAGPGGVPRAAGESLAADPPRPCAAIEVTRGVSVSGFLSDRYQWSDAACRNRSAALVRNDVQDPTGHWGGYLRQYVYDVDGSPRTVNGYLDRYPGFGILVNHFRDTYYAGHVAPGVSYGMPLAGRHHAIHEFKTRLQLGGGPVDATVHWFFATGRDHPVWSVTFDSTPAGPDAVQADTRAPYGELAWDGGAGSPVEGVEWGDRYVFRTTSTPLSFQSRWDYARPNTVPYVLQWSARQDAAMGLVQTQTHVQHDAGGYWAYSLWGKTSDAPDLKRELLEPGGMMPAAWNWPFQLNQYEIPFQVPNVTSRRIAWGTNYGAVGQRQYNAYGDDRVLSGYPYQSYSVFIVLGKHSAEPVRGQVAQVEAVQSVTLSPRTGAVVTAGPAGVGRSDTMAYDPPGYSHLYGTWELTADQSILDLDLNVASGALLNPVFAIHGYASASGEPAVLVDGQPLRADADYFASLDPTTQTLWLTLNRQIAGMIRLQVAG